MLVCSMAKNLKLKPSVLITYGQFALAVAFVGLPIYVHAPKFYAQTLGLPLGLLGVLMFLPRLLDALIDPFIGLWSDHYASRGKSRVRLILYTAPILAVSFLALFAPPAMDKAMLSLWMIAALFVIYIAYSLVTINMNALGVELSSDYHERTRITAWRESFFMVGLLLASALPQVLQNHFPPAQSYIAFGVVFAVLMGLSLVGLGWGMRQVKLAPVGRPGETKGYVKRLYRILRDNNPYRWLLFIGLWNATASAIPAALVLFYIEDVLQANAHTAGFLSVYFLAGAFGMPVWVKLSKTLGKRGAWIAAMLLAVACFGWAFFLQPGQIMQFYLICFAAGLSLGADYALPPSMLADIIAPDGKKEGAEAGTYMGLWILNSKLAMALSSAIALPLLAWLHYDPLIENSAASLAALSAVYALLPCIAKIAAAALLWISPIDRNLKAKRTK